MQADLGLGCSHMAQGAFYALNIISCNTCFRVRIEAPCWEYLFVVTSLPVLDPVWADWLWLSTVVSSLPLLVQVWFLGNLALLHDWTSQHDLLLVSTIGHIVRKCILARPAHSEDSDQPGINAFWSVFTGCSLHSEVSKASSRRAWWTVKACMLRPLTNSKYGVLGPVVKKPC